jgi:hypothetical protein
MEPARDRPINRPGFIRKVTFSLMPLFRNNTCLQTPTLLRSTLYLCLCPMDYTLRKYFPYDCYH